MKTYKCTHLNCLKTYATRFGLERHL